jgi:inward rectifier potassium channel
MFALTWVPMHRIDAASPLYGGAPAIEALKAQRAEMYLTFSGLDETMSQPIHARHVYKLDDIVLNARFADVLQIADDGSRTIDYARFHDVEHLGPPEALVWDAKPAGAKETTLSS